MRRLKEKSGFVHETVEEGCGTQGAGRGFDFFLQKESLGMVLMMGAIAVLPLLFTRAGVDSFEVPKRLGWACVALVLWRLNLGGRKEGTGVDWLWGIGLLLMGWMTGRTLGMGPVFRWIHGWAAWMMPLCLFFVGYHHERSEKQKRV